MEDRWPTETSIVLTLVLLGGFLSAASCTGFRIPTTPPSFEPQEFLSITQEEISLSAKSIVGRDAYWDYFDDNLPEIGIIAVWVSVRNLRAGKIDLSRSDWLLRTTTKQYKAMDSSGIMDVYYDEQRVRYRSQNADYNARRNLNNIMFMPGSVGPGLKRDGFLFFRLKEQADKEWSNYSTLQAEGVRLENGRKINLTLSFSNDNP